MTDTAHRIHLTADDLERLVHLRHHRRAQRAAKHEELALGERLSDWIAATVGSWHFILIQSTILALWIAANVVGWVRAWDPYPFILLNLVLSFQAAYTAPIIMMSQNRQADIDRERAKKDYEVNLKAELEIELLHQKIDMLREAEILRLTALVEELIGFVKAPLSAGDRSPSGSAARPGE